MRFVHIADVHLGMGFNSAGFGVEKGRERRREIKETLMNIIDYCEGEQMDLLLIAGDLFEEDYVTISDLKDINQRFAGLTKTRVMLAAGNHDPMIDANSPYRLITWAKQVHLFDTVMSHVYVEDCATEVWGFSWDKKSLPPFEAVDVSPEKGKYNILMLHGDVYQENEYQYIDKKVADSLGMDYVALGHIHKSDFISSSMAYPGSPEPLDFSEGGEHGFITGEITGEGCRLRFVPFAKRTFRKVIVDIDGTMTYEEIYQKVSTTLTGMPSRDFYRVILTGNLDPEVVLDLQDMKDRLADKVHYIEIEDETLPDMDLEQLAKEYEGSLVSVYIEAMTKKGLENPLVDEALKMGLRIMLEEQVRR